MQFCECHLISASARRSVLPPAGIRLHSTSRLRNVRNHTPPLPAETSEFECMETIQGWGRLLEIPGFSQNEAFLRFCSHPSKFEPAAYSGR